MRLNESLRINGDKVALVPYRSQHVPLYHGWMQSEELLSATASERLSLEEEYDNCNSWHDDERKCTFILLRQPDDTPAGDVNLFLNIDEEPTAAEIEIMVADVSARRRGCAAEALQLIQAWASQRLGVRRFVAKIGVSNAASLALFRKLHYRHVSTSSVFQEETLELVVDEARVQEHFGCLRLMQVADDAPLGVTLPTDPTTRIETHSAWFTKKN
jgi:hypothetical protein